MASWRLSLRAPGVGHERLRRGFELRTLSASFAFAVLLAFFDGAHGFVARLAAAEGPSREPRTAATPALTTAAAGNPLWAVPLTELSATRERPIFSPSRRPPPSPVVAAPAPVIKPEPVPPPPKMQRPTLKLVGTIIGEARQIGVFLEETTEKIVRLEVGQGHGGWILRLVNSLQAQFDSADRSATLALRQADLEQMKGAEAPATTELLPPVRHRKR
jgi:general secretion pathway protein N